MQYTIKCIKFSTNIIKCESQIVKLHSQHKKKVYLCRRRIW